MRFDAGIPASHGFVFVEAAGCVLVLYLVVLIAAFEVVPRSVGVENRRDGDVGPLALRTLELGGVDVSLKHELDPVSMGAGDGVVGIALHVVGPDDYFFRDHDFCDAFSTLLLTWYKADGFIDPMALGAEIHTTVIHVKVRPCSPQFIAVYARDTGHGLHDIGNRWVPFRIRYSHRNVEEERHGSNVIHGYIGVLLGECLVFVVGIRIALDPKA